MDLVLLSHCTFPTSGLQIRYYEQVNNTYISWVVEANIQTKMWN